MLPLLAEPCAVRPAAVTDLNGGSAGRRERAEPTQHADQLRRRVPNDRTATIPSLEVLPFSMREEIFRLPIPSAIVTCAGPRCL
jgi:hypothetical protein